MKRIKHLVAELDALVNETWSDHLNYHDKFNEYRGRELSPDDIQAAQEAFEGIQETYEDIAPAFRFVGQRVEFVGNAITSYNAFIDQLQKQGVILEHPDFNGSIN